MSEIGSKPEELELNKSAVHPYSTELGCPS
jgi:hypothetical protein